MKEYKILGNGIVKIKDSDFIAKGGEGSVFKYKDKVIKIYHNDKDAITKGKFDELSVLEKNCIIKPMELVLDKKDRIIGFTMKNIHDYSIPLRRLFNNSFWRENNISVHNIIKLVEFMQEITEYIHQKNILIVDYNDLNVNYSTNNIDMVYYIDVNSYSTENYKSVTIQPFYKDYHTNGYNRLTDWFSFGILIFQLFTGIHPFKGNHPNYGISKDDTLKRMRDNASIYDKNVIFNSKMRDLSIIPQNYNKWFENMFRYGKRIEPPGSAGLVNYIQVVKKIEDGNFEITLIKEFEKEIKDYKSVYAKDIVLLNDSIFIDNEKFDYSSKSIDIIIDSSLDYYNVEIHHLNMLCFRNLKTNELIRSDIRLESFLIIDNELYIKNNGDFHHIKLLNINKKILTINNSWDIMPYSSYLYKNIVYQNILGKFWVSIPVSKKNWVVNLNIKELNDKKILDMKRIQHILFVVVKEDDIKKYIIKFDENYEKYKVFDIKDSEYFNFVVLDNKLVVNMEDKEIEIFDSNFDKDKKKILNHDIIDVELVNKDSNVMFFRGNKLYKMTNKK